MNAGKMRQRVTLQRQTDTGGLDDYGQPLPPWEDVASVWAAVDPLEGRELWAAQQVNAEISARISIRYREGVTTQMRVAFGDRLYDVLSLVDPEEGHRELQLLCRQVVAEMAGVP
jgi:SPP1 family predicted phage head-tail adaptor